MQNLAFQYDSAIEERWMNAAKNYLIGEWWEMLDLLDWVEKFGKMPTSPRNYRLPERSWEF